MTTSTHPPVPSAGLPWQRRSDAELLDDQLSALARWSRDQQERRATAADIAALSREMRLDQTRRMEVLRRQQQALLARADAQLRSGFDLLSSGRPRVLLVHRNAWLRDKVSHSLSTDIDVVAALDNGADAVGFAVAEQPDFVLVEDSLPLLSGLEVLAQLRQYCPRTILTAQVGHDDAVTAFVAAGARGVWSRRVPPADIADGIRALLLT